MDLELSFEVIIYNDNVNSGNCNNGSMNVDNIGDIFFMMINKLLLFFSLGVVNTPNSHHCSQYRKGILPLLYGFLFFI